MFALVAGEFAQAQSRRRARGYLLGLLSQAERKNGWSIAEFAGDGSPAGMQRLLNFYAWDADAVRDVTRGYVITHLGDPAGVLAADETGFLKKGRKSAGVQRQYTGTAGRIENCQVGVFLAYAAPGGARAFLDRELYVPESWFADRDRCREAGIGDEAAFATKPELARRMLERSLAAGVPFSWFTADEVYGENPGLRSWLDGEHVGYVMAVPCSQRFDTTAGTMRADGLAALVPADGWQILSDLRQDPATAGLPIIICTALPVEDLALSLGATAFLQKPVTQEQFLRVLDQQVRLSEWPAALQPHP